MYDSERKNLWQSELLLIVLKISYYFVEVCQRAILGLTLTYGQYKCTK